MNSEANLKRWPLVSLGLAGLLCAGLVPLPAEAHGSHPRGSARTAECSLYRYGTEGQTRRIAKHLAGYARDVRYRIGGLVTEADNQRVTKELSYLLRWKLGGAEAVCATYVGHGYSHFEKAYADEAAAMYMGILRATGRYQRSVEIPRWMADSAPSSAKAAKAMQQVDRWRDEANLVIAARFDVPNGLVNLVIQARAEPFLETRALPGSAKQQDPRVTAKGGAAGGDTTTPRVGTPSVRSTTSRTTVDASPVTPGRQARMQTTVSLGPEHALSSLGKDIAAFKTQIGETRSRIKPKVKIHTGVPKNPAAGATVARRISWAEDCCSRNLRDMRGLAGSLSRTVSQLEGVYRRVNHAQGRELSAEMAANVTSLKKAIDSFAAAPNSAAGQSALNNLGKVLGLLEQKKAKADSCCEFAPPGTVPVAPARQTSATGVQPRGTTGTTARTTTGAPIGRQASAATSAGQAQIQSRTQPATGPTAVAVERTSFDHGRPDLIPRSLGLTLEGQVRYTVRNGGGAGTGKFVTDVRIRGLRRETVKHDPLAASGQQAVVAKLARFPDCDPGVVEVVVDSQLTVGEFNEGNNKLGRKLTPPCPDLTASIRRNWTDRNTRYRVQVTIVNQGNGAMRGPTFVRIASFGLSAPHMTTRRVPPLAPGAAVSFTVGRKHLGTSNRNVRVDIDEMHLVPESNEDNNVLKKRL